MAKKSETLVQRQKAQRDIIELRKMQAGEIAPGPKPSEEAVMPKTFKEKVANFFYHYKATVIIGAFLVAVLAILIVNLVTRVNYDSKVIVFSYDSAYSLFNTKVAEYFETLYDDVNGNGKVEIAAIDCSIDPKTGGDMRTAKISKLNTMLTVDVDTLLFLMDEESIKHFTDNLDVEIFKEENMVPLSQEFYDFIEIEDSGVPETKLFVAMREVDGTAIEGKDEASHEAAKKVIALLKEKAGEE